MPKLQTTAQIDCVVQTIMTVCRMSYGLAEGCLLPRLVLLRGG
eukprot:COSAG03_NODE_27237_length_254_cov_0.832258_1_plen_42_part_01